MGVKGLTVPWKTSEDGYYYIFEGKVSIPTISGVNIVTLEDPRSRERRELAAVTSQGFADCVYPPPRAGAWISGTADEYTITLTLSPSGAIGTLPLASGPSWRDLGYTSGGQS